MSSGDVLKKDDVTLDLALRPSRWDEYIGQEKIKNNLRILIEAAQKRGEPIEHVLLYGPAGLGKTTLAHLVGREMGTTMKVTSGPAIEKAGDLAAILTNMEEGGVLFIDEAHRIHKVVEEMLYPAMESSTLDIILGKGPSAKTIQLHLPRFTIIAATTRAGLLSSPFRSRFGATHRLDFYREEEIERIIRRSAALLKARVNDDAVKTIARASRFTPRVANRILKRVRDYAQVHNMTPVTRAVAQKALAVLEVDAIGLETTDVRILEAIITKYGGGPVGLKSVAASTSEEVETIEDVYEPYLLQIGFLSRSPKGRIATKHAYEHLGIPYHDKDKQGLLL
ncbi:Holliday junction branch migration DNA helicase RuvB [Candidatus Azambacteria bacterium]|nr:Holliday junction branch migration DNA helicase RuvB [Candidatus Azambacteria bacterium]